MAAPSTEAVSFCIIGGGLTGTSMLCQFVLAVKDGLRRGRRLRRNILIQVVEKSRVFGPGFPHSDRQSMPFHLLNMCARDMSILLSRPNDFEIWVERHGGWLKSKFPVISKALRRVENPDGECRHYPRAVMGEYLKARFREAVSEAENLGISVRLYPEHEATDLQEERDGTLQIQLVNQQSRSKKRLFADRVLLATGHWFQTSDNGPGFFSAPWPARLLESRIPEGSRVAIIGTSLSAIDAVLTLTADGTFLPKDSGELIYRPTENSRHLTLFSRRALLPAVRGRNGVYQNRFFTEEGIMDLLARKCELALEDLFMLLDRDLRCAYGCPFPWDEVTKSGLSPKKRLEKAIQDARYGDGPNGELLWQTVLQQVFPMVRKAYLALSQEERIRFEKKFSTLFFVHAAPMPMINALKLSALMDSGIVCVRQVVQDPPFRREGDAFCFAFKGPKHETRIESYPFVVDARGQGRFYSENPERLAVNLLESGTVEIEPRPSRIRPGNSTGNSASKERIRGTGSLWVDPDTHRVLRTGREGGVRRSNTLYAVGAMTRAQIIDASMAHGSAVSTETIAKEWMTLVF